MPTGPFRVSCVALARAAAVSCIVLTAETAAACHVPNFNFTFGQPASVSMTAVAGAPCTLKLREGPFSVFKKVAVVSRPAKGSVSVLSPSNVAYRASPGYQGQDSFVFNLTGTKGGAPLTTRLTVTVTVTVSGHGGGASGASPAATRDAPRARPQRQATAAGALQARCLQDAGAGRDPVTGQMQFYLNHPSRMDRFKMCMAGGDRAKANAIAVPELTRVHPGDRGPTYKGR